MKSDREIDANRNSRVFLIDFEFYPRRDARGAYLGSRRPERRRRSRVEEQEEEDGVAIRVGTRRRTSPVGRRAGTLLILYRVHEKKSSVGATEQEPTEKFSDGK